jgi:hypothetical protein
MINYFCKKLSVQGVMGLLSEPGFIGLMGLLGFFEFR